MAKARRVRSRSGRQFAANSPQGRAILAARGGSGGSSSAT